MSLKPDKDPKLELAEQDTVNKFANQDTDINISEVETSCDKTAEANGTESSTTINFNGESKTTNHNVNPDHIHYEDGVCIYTDPDSKCQFNWDDHKQEWIARKSDFAEKDYEYDGTRYTYTDKDTNFKYFWDEVANEWKNADKSAEVRSENLMETEGEESVVGGLKTNESDKLNPGISKEHYSYENDTHVYTDPSDGSKYFWDKERSAWIPKVDDDFLAQYQMNYGFVDPSANAEEEKKPEPAVVEEKEKRKTTQEPTWFDVGEESTKVYVSGLPLDILETEFVDVMQKCGLVMRDPDSGNMKVKIYLDPETSLPKGDALCTYIKKESVDLALNLLDGSEVRGHRIKVEKAKFTMKGQAYDPSLKPKKRRKKDKEKLKKIQEKLLDWRPDKMRGERSKHENIVIVKNLFDPVIFNKDVKLILEYQQDLRDECLKCGSVKKVIIYDRHSEGVAQISFKEVDAADACVQLLNGRWFGQRKITAETWDGKTKYKITETDEQIKERLQKWQKYLESGEQQEEKGSGTVQSKVEVEVANNSNEYGTNSAEVAGETSKDSDHDTVSNVGSDYDTDDEIKPSK